MVNLRTEIRAAIAILLLAGPFAYAFGYASESLVLSKSLSFPVALATIALIEETAKWLVYRNLRFVPGLIFILVLAGMESLMYALIAEYFFTWLVIGVVFWYVLLMRFIFSGHLMFYLASRLVSEVSETIIQSESRIAYSLLRMTGKNVNVLGLSSGILLHVYWNYFAIQNDEIGFHMLMIPLSLVVLITVMRYLMPRAFKMG